MLKKTCTIGDQTGDFWDVVVANYDKRSDQTTCIACLFSSAVASKDSELAHSMPFVLKGNQTKAQALDALKTVPKVHLRRAAIAIPLDNFFADAEVVPLTPALPAIPNATPPEVSSFNRFWVTKLTISGGTSLEVVLAPYDGQFILAGANKAISVPDVSINPALAQLSSMAQSLVQSRSGKASPPLSIVVESPAPNQPAGLTGTFAGDETFEIEDIFTLAATDMEAAQVLGGLLTWIASSMVPVIFKTPIDGKTVVPAPAETMTKEKP